MATSTTMFVLSSGNLGDEAQLLKHETRLGEQPGFCSDRRIRRHLLMNQVMFLWKPETLKTHWWKPTLLKPLSMSVNFMFILPKQSMV